MASTSKRPRREIVPNDEIYERIFNEENTAQGMDSDEESELDRRLENETEESR